MKLVKVEWVDSCGPGSEWTPLAAMKEIQDNLLCISVGYLVKNEVDFIIVVPHIYPEDEKLHTEASGSGELLIPTSAIVNVTVLED